MLQISKKLRPEFGVLIVSMSCEKNEFQDHYDRILTEKLAAFISGFSSKICRAVFDSEFIYELKEREKPVLNLLSFGGDPIREYVKEIADCEGLLSSGILWDHPNDDFGASYIIPKSEFSYDSYDKRRLSMGSELGIALCDALIVINNKKFEQEFSEFAVFCIRDAIRVGRPIFLLDSHGDVRISSNLSRGFEANQSDQYALDDDINFFQNYAICDDEITSWIVQKIVDPVDSGTGLETQEIGYEKLREYFCRIWSVGLFKRKAGLVDNLLSLILGGGNWLRAFTIDNLRNWYGVRYEEITGNNKYMIEPSEFEERFRLSDTISNVAAGWHRDLIWILYFFSAFAVFAAIGGAINLWPNSHGHGWAVAELFAVGSIIILVQISKFLGWHRQWLTHRFLAEQIRYARAALIFGVYLKPAQISPYIAEQIQNKRIELRLGNAEQWILRRLIVANGAPRNPEGLTFYYGSEIDELTEYLRYIISDQAVYHEKKAHLCHKIWHRLHIITTLCFIVTLFGIIAHFFFHDERLLIVTAALPALAAALHGILTQSEYRKIYLISNSTARQLRGILLDLERKKNDERSQDVSWYQLRSIARHAFEIMSGVSEEWQALIRERETNLPA